MNLNLKILAFASLSSTLIEAKSSLPPLSWSPLPHGSVHPEGWLYRQLRIQGDGLSGNFENFWGPVANSTWTGGNDKEEDWVEIWPYVIAGYVPQAILLNDAAQLRQSQSWIDYLLDAQAADGHGWLGPSPSERDGGMLYWPQWPIVLTFMAWREYGLQVNGTEDPRLLAGSLAWLHNASGMLTERPMGRDWSGTRWQDWTYVIQVVQDCPSTPDSEQAFLTALSQTVYDQGTKNGMDWAAYYSGPSFPKDAVGGWDYAPHGVNNGMAAKGGAVSWRAGQDPTGNVSSWVRDDMLMTYHGSPSGIFQADECLAGRMPSKGAETCLVVEQLFSLNIVHEVQGDAFFAERAEHIAYNALPSVGTKDMWSRVYLQAANEVFAGHADPHPWNTDGDDSVIYSVGDNYFCCTANFNQGWPRFVQHMLHSSPDGGVAVSSLGPVSASLPNGVLLNVSGEYPFEDDVTVTLSGLSGTAIPLYIRIPSWATNASITVNGGSSVPVGAFNGTMYKVSYTLSSSTVSVVLSTNPTVRLVPWYNGAMAVYRGALLYSLRLDETFVVTNEAPLDARAKDYIVTTPGCDLSPQQPQCTAPFNVALVVDDPAHPEAGFTFQRTGEVPLVPFAAGLWGASNLELTANVRSVASWGIDLNEAAPPPSSPVNCDDPAACGPTYPATFVPYGATHLRMSELPWTTRPPCGTPVAFNASGSVLASSFDTYGGASITANGPLQNIRSGDPGDVSTAAFIAVVIDPTHTVASISFNYQYVAGYGPDGAPGGVVLELIALTPGPCGSQGTEIVSLYKSEPLIHYPFDVCNTCYSPPQNVSVTGLKMDVTGGVIFALRFTDNDRNVQLKLPMTATVTWN